MTTIRPHIGIDWTAHLAAKATARRRKKLHHPKVRNWTKEDDLVQMAKPLILYGHSRLNRAAPIFGGSMTRCINLDTYDR